VTHRFILAPRSQDAGQDVNLARIADARGARRASEDTRRSVMRQSDQPEIVTLVASPPAGTTGSTDNTFIDAALATLASKQAHANRIVRVSCVRDADIELGKILTGNFKGTIRLQIVGHSISGMLMLGGAWIAENELVATAFRHPYYVLDTNPASLGLLAKYAGKIAEVQLVGCNVGAASSYGYAINGRTLTYTLAELLRCVVRGADDVVAPSEFDAHGWYTAGPHHRRPKGWRWVEDLPPVWTALGTDPVAGGRATTTRWFELRAIVSALLPAPAVAHPLELTPVIHLSSERIASEAPVSALPELSVETDQGTGQLLCGGKYLHLNGTYYVVDQTAALAAALTETLWSSAVPDLGPADQVVTAARAAR
jgi:hypothetical protein